MEAFKVRLINEQFELQEKINTLNGFINSESFGNIDIFQQNLLKEQIVAMESYNNILIKRLAALGMN
jgi:hypothetical protein